MTTLTITPMHTALRSCNMQFVEAAGTPVEVREAFFDVLMPLLPAGLDPEQVGWTLEALTGALVLMISEALAQNGPASAESLLSPRLLATLATTAEGFISRSELPVWTD